MRRVWAAYLAGVLFVSAGVAGVWLAPEFLGFIPLGAGLVWAAYDLIDADEGGSE